MEERYTKPQIVGFLRALQQESGSYRALEAELGERFQLLSMVARGSRAMSDRLAIVILETYFGTEEGVFKKAPEVYVRAVHDRVLRKRGKVEKCEHCGMTKGRTSRALAWVNVSGRHDDPSDYIGLCGRCRNKYLADRSKGS